MRLRNTILGIIVIALSMTMAIPNSAWSGMEDRGSYITLRTNPYNFILGPELASDPTGDPASGWWRLFGKANNIYFEDDTGTVTALLPAGATAMYSFESLTVESGGTAASVTQVVSFITTNGDGDEDAVTLADGTIGQVKIFVSAVEGAGGDSYKITPAHMNGGTKITFDGTVGDGCTMIFDGTSWNIVSNNGGTIS